MESLPTTLAPDRNRASSLLAIFWVPFPLTVFLLGARPFVRLRIKNVGLDDYAMLLAWVFYTVALSLSSVCMAHGGARHLYYLEPQDVVLVLKYNFMSQPFGALAAVVGKSSVALLMLRIIGPKTDWRKRFLYLQLVIYMAITVVNIVLLFAQCSPSRALWEKVQGSKCWAPNIVVDITILLSAYGTLMYFLLAAFPITVLWSLKISLQQKVGLSALLSLGVFAGICAAIKTSHLHSFAATADFTWATYSIFAWSSIEISLVIICGCMPAMKPIFDYISKGKPLRPGRSHLPNASPYNARCHATGPGNRKSFGRPAVLNKIRSTSATKGRSDTMTGSTVKLLNIRIEHGIDVYSHGRGSFENPSVKPDHFEVRYT